MAMKAAKKVSIAEAKDRLPALIHEVEGSREPVEITRRGKVVAVLLSSAELERLKGPKETLVEKLERIRKEAGKDYGFTKKELASLRADIPPPRDFSFDDE